MKKLLSLLIALLMLCSFAFAEEAAAPEVTVSGDFGYALQEDGTAALYTYAGTDTEITLPAEIDGIAVTAVGAGFLAGNDTVTSVAIPSGIVLVDENAFSGCAVLSKVTFPNTLRTIRSGAFSGCPAMKTLRVSNSVTSIGSGTFADCANLELHVTSGTMAELYADNNGIPYVSYD